MFNLREWYQELLRRGIVFRFSPDQLASLKARSLGLGFDPPSRTVETRHGTMIEEVIPTSFEPIVITKAQWSACQRICEAWELFFRYAFRMYTDPALRAMLNGKHALIANPSEREHCADQSGYTSLMPFVRYDCVVRPDGTFAVMDVNSSRPIGAGHLFALTSMFEERKLTEAMPIATPDLLASVIRRCYEEKKGSGADGSVDLAIAVQESHGSNPDFQVLAKQLRKTKQFGSVTLYDPEDLRFDPCTRRLYGTVDGTETSLDLVMRTVKPDLHPGIAPALAEAYASGGPCIVAPLWRRWLGNKLWMALAQVEPMRSEIASALGPYAEDFFGSLPRTGLYQGGRVLFPDGTARLETLKPSQWVAKVPAGSSARGVLIGRTMSAAAWFEGVAGFSDSTVIIQEFIEPERIALTIPDGKDGAQRGMFLTKHGLFSFGGKAAGIEVHACLDSYKIHGGRGTLAVPAFVGH